MSEVITADAAEHAAAEVLPAGLPAADQKLWYGREHIAAVLELHSSWTEPFEMPSQYNRTLATEVEAGQYVANCQFYLHEAEEHDRRHEELEACRQLIRELNDELELARKESKRCWNMLGKASERKDPQAAREKWMTKYNQAEGLILNVKVKLSEAEKAAEAADQRFREVKKYERAEAVKSTVWAVRRRVEAERKARVAELLQLARDERGFPQPEASVYVPAAEAGKLLKLLSAGKSSLRLEASDAGIKASVYNAGHEFTANLGGQVEGAMPALDVKLVKAQLQAGTPLDLQFCEGVLYMHGAAGLSAAEHVIPSQSDRADVQYLKAEGLPEVAEAVQIWSASELLPVWQNCTAVAISDSTSGAVHYTNGVFLTGQGNWCATDGHRLVLWNLSELDDTELELLIPASVLKLALKFLPSKVTAKRDPLITLERLSDRYWQLVIEANGSGKQPVPEVRITFLRLDVKFPDFRRVTGTEGYEYRVADPAGELPSHFKAILPFAGARDRNPVCKVSVQHGRLMLSAEGTDRATVAADDSVWPELHVNPQYGYSTVPAGMAMDVLACSSVHPLMFVDAGTGGAQFMAVIMPIRMDD